MCVFLYLCACLRFDIYVYVLIFRYMCLSLGHWDGVFDPVQTLLFGPYGVATTSRLLKSISLFCKRALQKRLYSAKETYNFEEPTDRSHPIPSTPT